MIRNIAKVPISQKAKNELLEVMKAKNTKTCFIPPQKTNHGFFGVYYYEGERDKPKKLCNIDIVLQLVV
jgi:hypothetical protein